MKQAPAGRVHKLQTGLLWAHLCFRSDVEKAGAEEGDVCDDDAFAGRQVPVSHVAMLQDLLQRGEFCEFQQFVKRA
jgi:hypothetical protein